MFTTEKTAAALDSGVIRKMKSDDTLHVMAIWAAYVQKYHAFLSDSWMAETRLLMSTQYLQASSVSVYEYQGKIVGFVAMVDTYVGVLFVEQIFEGQGIAKALLESVNILDDDLITSAYSKNTDGCHFYERHGFVFLKEDIHEISGEKMSHYYLPRK